MASPEIIPAILTNDPNDLNKKLRLCESFAHSLHIDIMDGVYVASTSVTANHLRDAAPQLPFELHMMVRQPSAIINPYLALGPQRVIIHPDSERTNVVQLFKHIQESGSEASVAFAKSTVHEDWSQLIAMSQQITFVTVQLGGQGNPLQTDVLVAAATFCQLHPKGIIEIDGGVNAGTIGSVLPLHPSRIVIGSGIWNAADPKAAYEELVRRSASVP